MQAAVMQAEGNQGSGTERMVVEVGTARGKTMQGGRIMGRRRNLGEEVGDWEYRCPTGPNLGLQISELFGCTCDVVGEQDTVDGGQPSGCKPDPGRPCVYPDMGLHYRFVDLCSGGGRQGYGPQACG